MLASARRQALAKYDYLRGVNGPSLERSLNAYPDETDFQKKLAVLPFPKPINSALVPGPAGFSHDLGRRQRRPGPKCVPQF
jgi:hypothetical protein